MSKIITLTVIAGTLATLTPAEAKISHCLDDAGHSTFSDHGCDVKKSIMKSDTYLPTVIPLSRKKPPAEITNKEGEIMTYCHKGNGKFYRC